MKPKFSLVLMALAVCTVLAQHAPDSLLFTISLNADSQSLFYCGRPEDMSRSLAGPVFMARHALLFYSNVGYALYDVNGKLLETHDVIAKNRSRRRVSPPKYVLAYPVDTNTVVYYRDLSTKDSLGFEMYEKHLKGRNWSKIEGPLYQRLRPVVTSRLYNCAHPTITGELDRVVFLTPQLAGFTDMAEASRHWWSLEKFYTFTSPLVAVEKGGLAAFFPGLDYQYVPAVKKSLIEPVGACRVGDQWIYYGVSSAEVADREKSTQRLYICDYAGNLIYTYDLLKRTMVDAVLGENKAEKMVYTVRKTGKHASVPTIDCNGDIYYSVTDFDAGRIEVKRRRNRIYVPAASGPFLEQELQRESAIALGVDSLDCTESRQVRLSLPRLRFTDYQDSTREMTEEQLTVEGFCARIARTDEPELRTILRRSQAALPPAVQRLQDSLATVAAIGCPYRLFLHKKIKGVVASLRYGLGDSLLAARVIGVAKPGDVFVRVDLADRAEVVVFSSQGMYLNRFIFNRQRFSVRKDVITVSPHRLIMEKDFEVSNGGYRYCTWQLQTASDTPVTARH
jgi:hypothetical protein